VVPEHFAVGPTGTACLKTMSLLVEGVRAWAPGGSCEGRARTDPTGRTRIAQTRRRPRGARHAPSPVSIRNERGHRDG
jgi:hypothetical protein